MDTFLGVTTREKTSATDGSNVLTHPNAALNHNTNEETQMNVIESLRKAFRNSVDGGAKENIFAQNAGVNVFISNVIDDKQDVIDKLSEVLDAKFDTLDEKLYKIDEIIEKFAKCKSENETLKAKMGNLKDENYVLKSELGKFNRLGFGVFVKKQ